MLEDITGQGFDLAGISGERLLVNWHLVRETKTDVGTHPTPTLTGILFIASHPQQFLPYAYVSAQRIPGTDISAEPYDQKHIEGRMVDILHYVMRFLDIHLMHPHRHRASFRTRSRSSLCGGAFMSCVTRAVYNVFLKLGFVIDAGSGILRMIRVFRDATGQEPILRMEGNEFVTAFPRSFTQ